MDKYIEKVNITEIYITKNILKIFSDKEKYEQDYNYIIKNPFLLRINNTDLINSITILINNNYVSDVIELLNLHPQIITYNIINKLIYKPEYYETILNIFKNKDNCNLIKKITKLDAEGDFIENLIYILNKNKDLIENETIKNEILLLFGMIKEIYDLDDEKNTLIITILCKSIKSEKLLLDIFEFINIQNFDICYNYYINTSPLDYLFFNQYISVIEYLIDRLNYIYFSDINDILLFDYFKNHINILFKILEKSNIHNIINNKNQNIFYFILDNFDIEFNVLFNYLVMFNIDIYEKDVYGINLYSLIIKKYNNVILDELNKNSITKYIEDNISQTQIDNISKLLIKKHYGLYNPNSYTSLFNQLYIINKYNTTYIPFIKLSDSEINNTKQLLKISKQYNTSVSIIKTEFKILPEIIHSYITWKNENENWISPELINLIKSSNNRYILLHSTISGYNSLHANCILIDKHNKTVELFEPYGRLNYDYILLYNKWIKIMIANELNYNFEQVQLYTGFQLKSDEHNIDNEFIGDPGGYCLAWCILYLDIRLNNEFIDSTNKYTNAELTSCLINVFIMNNYNGKYLNFIRDYSIYLIKNRDNVCIDYNINYKLLYHKKYSYNVESKIIKCLNSFFNDITNKKKEKKEKKEKKNKYIK